MNKQTTLTLKIIDDSDVLDSLPRKELTAEHKALIKFIAKVAVQEYLEEERVKQAERSRYDGNVNGDRVLRLREVLKITGLSRSSIYLQMKDGNFPQKICLGGRSVGWKESDINAWIENREQAL